jgi:sec-independent protein translocase protein TatA
LGELSIWHWLVVLIVVLLLFGSGKVSTLMGDVAKGIKAFRANMQDDADSKPSRRPDAEAQAALSAEQRRDDGEHVEKTLAHREG